MSALENKSTFCALINDAANSLVTHCCLRPSSIHIKRKTKNNSKLFEMTASITCVLTIIFIPTLILASETLGNSGLKDNSQAVNHRNRTNANAALSTNSESQELGKLDSNYLVNRNFYEIRKSRTKKKRQAAHGTKSSQHAKNVHFHKSSKKQNKQSSNSHNNNNKNVKIYETFEEIHEHINEPASHDVQFDASNRYEEHDKSSVEVQSAEERKEDKHVKIKVKHHHHHHHHNHVKEVIKSVPKPYPVEKIVHIPVEKIVEKIVHVPKFVNVTVEKIIRVPFEKIVEKVVRVPKPVHVPQPYMVEKIMEKIIHVPKPYPVLKTVPYPVEIKVPVPYEKKIGIPYTVEVERKVPVYISSQEPYKYEPTHSSSPFKERNLAKFSSTPEESSHYPVYFPESYNKPNSFKLTSNEPTQNYNFNAKPSSYQQTELPRNVEYKPHINNDPEDDNYNIYKPNPFKQTETPRKTDYQTLNQANEHYNFAKATSFKQPEQPKKPEYEQTENYNFNQQPNPFKLTELPKKHDYQTNNEQTDQFTNIDNAKIVNDPIEPSAAGSTFIPVKFIDPKSPFNIIVANNDTTFDFNTPIYGNKIHEMPFSFPIEFVQMQPMPFHSPLRIESPIPQASFNST